MPTHASRTGLSHFPSAPSTTSRRHFRTLQGFCWLAPRCCQAVHGSWMGLSRKHSTSLRQQLATASDRLDVILAFVRGQEDAELLATLNNPAYAQSLSEIERDLQPLLDVPAVPGEVDCFGDAAARFLVGYTQHLLGQPKTALACCTAALAAWTEAPASWHYVSAQVAVAAGEIDLAELCLRGAIDRDVQHLPAHLELMGLLADRNDFRACRALAGAAAAQTPKLHWSSEWQRPDHMLPGLHGQVRRNIHILRQRKHVRPRRRTQSHQ